MKLAEVKLYRVEEADEQNCLVLDDLAETVDESEIKVAKDSCSEASSSDAEIDGHTPLIIVGFPKRPGIFPARSFRVS